MYDKFKQPDVKILAATSFEDSESNLLAYAKSMKDALGAKVRLTHVNDVVLSHAWGQVYPSGYYDPTLLNILEKEAKQEAEKQLDELTLSYFQADKAVETACMTGLVADALDADARTSRSSLILVGLAEKSYRFMPKGLSTTLSLMSTAHVPVLAVPSDVKQVRQGKSVNIVICDDLYEHSFSAVTTAVELAVGFKNANVYHLHVHKESPERIRKTARHIQELMDLNRLPFNKSFNAETFLADTQAKIRQKLESRMGDAKLIIEESGGKYTSEVLFGDVQENLKAYAESKRPDMIVFGRHEVLHKKPLGVGKLPFYTMTQLGVPVMVAPTTLA
jgi:nucleotide-binding universal stress UspA family protein